MSLNHELQATGYMLYPILQNIDEGLVITNTDLEITFINDKAMRLFDIIGQNFMGQPVDSLKPNLEFGKMLKNQQHYQQDYVTMSGYKVLINKALLEAPGGNYAAYALLHCMDQFQDYELNTLLENPYEGIVVVDDQARLIYANQACYRFFDCTHMNQLTDELAALVPRINLRQCLETGRPMASDLITIRDQRLELIYLPITRDDKSLGVIIKSHPYYRAENTWTTIVEDYKKGTARYYLEDIIGQHESIEQKKTLVRKAARTTSTVLITGESGTGKELFAHAIHNLSPRRKEPFVRVNCAAVPETLLESELFGYAEGAFTGARKEGKPGKFELANQGTLFLDEIGDMSLAMQTKLLRVLQEKEIERIGATHTTRVNVRVIAATNQDLKRLIARGQFREDLYFRLNVLVLDIPPLRERKTDIADISKALLYRLNQELHTDVYGISPEVLDRLGNYTWPGNIRELENILERAINICDGSTIQAEHLPEYITNNSAPSFVPVGSLEEQMAEHEKLIIRQTLQQCKGNRTQTARVLGIHRSVLYRKMHRYNIIGD